MPAAGEDLPVARSLAVDAARLSAAACRLAGSGPPFRAALALATARAVAAAAGQWTDVAVAIKRRPASGSGAAGEAATAVAPGVAARAIVADEVSTGPLATLRLLLVTAASFADIARYGRPRAAGPPRLVPRPASGSEPAAGSFVGVDLLTARGLWDGVIFTGHAAAVRCVDPGGLAAFAGAWRDEARARAGGGGVALVLGAGNVTGLAVADAICQIFEHGRAVILKLHPLHAPLERVLRAALAPLVAADLLAIIVGGPEVATEWAGAAAVTHLHLTGGRAAFDSLVWGGPGPHDPAAAPRLAKPLTCELGNLTPWFVVPGRYSAAELASQADLVAGSIVHNGSLNCIATKCLVTSRRWTQREEFLALVARRLASQPPRVAWYPGSVADWEALAAEPAPRDGTLPWLFRTGLEAAADTPWLEREWFIPATVEVAIEADSGERFLAEAAALARRLPGTLAASVTIPRRLPPAEAAAAERFVTTLGYGVLGVNTWVAVAYTLAAVPWGGYPGGTLAEPGSGLGRVHDPLLLPGVHHAVVRGPLAARLTPPWVAWHRRADDVARGLVRMYAALAQGRIGLPELVAQVPAVFAG